MADARPDFDDNARPIADGVISVGTVATKLSISSSLNQLAEYIIVENLSNSIMWLGTSAVAVDRGTRLRRNQKAVISCTTGDEWFAVVGSGTADLFVMEMGS